MAESPRTQGFVLHPTTHSHGNVPLHTYHFQYLLFVAYNVFHINDNYLLDTKYSRHSVQVWVMLRAFKEAKVGHLELVCWGTRLWGAEIKIEDRRFHQVENSRSDQSVDTFVNLWKYICTFHKPNLAISYEWTVTMVTLCWRPQVKRLSSVASGCDRPAEAHLFRTQPLLAVEWKSAVIWSVNTVPMLQYYQGHFQDACSWSFWRGWGKWSGTPWMRENKRVTS